nr:acyl-CoA dehydrogenase family protein [Mycobacterium leprae]
MLAGLADLGLFAVAVFEDCGGAGGNIEDLGTMVEEAAKALVSGPVTTTPLAMLVVPNPELLYTPASGESFAGLVNPRRR